MRSSLLFLGFLGSGALLAAHAHSQRLVSLDGTPGLTSVYVPPLVTVPPCTPAGVCPVPLPPFGPGIAMPSFGAEAIDEATATAYTSNGVLIAATGFPGCVPGPVFPAAAWPAGPCGAIAASPIISMADAGGAGTIWVLNATGLVTLIPFPPGPPLAQAFAPAAAMVPMASGITWNPATGLLHFVGFGAPVVFTTPAPAGFACAPLPLLGVNPIPPCLPPPYVGVTINTAVAPGPIPALVVSNGIFTASILAGMCTCPVMPPAAMPTTDIDFADVPVTYGPGCGCAATIGTAGGLPVVGNAGFGITATGGPQGNVAVLLIAGGPAAIPLGACTLLVAPGFLSLPPIPVVPVGPGPCATTAGVPLPIPPAAVLAVGATLYLQWVFFPSPLPGGFEMSNGLELTIGFA